MSAELASRTLERPIQTEGEIVLAEGVPSPVSASPSFENTQVFFSALSFPIDSKNPPSPFGYKKTGTQQAYEKWARNWEILGWHLGTDRVLEEIRGKYTITRESIRTITKELVSQAYRAAPATLKEAFPKASLDIKKPYSLHRSMRKSQALGGKMREVAEAVLAGKSNEEIRAETGASKALLMHYRSIGIAIPYFNEAQGKEYQENLRFLANGLLDDRQILAIFEDIEKYNRYAVCRALEKAGVLVSLGKTARSKGIFIHKSESAAYRLLKKLGIPVLRVENPFTDKNGERKTRHCFFALNNHEKTREAFTNPSFDAFRINPVLVLGRVPEVIPTTSIRKDSGYTSVVKLLRERGMSIRGEKVRKYLGPDCPVSVFYVPRKKKDRGSLLVLEEDSDALADYLNAKLASLPRA